MTIHPRLFLIYILVSILCLSFLAMEIELGFLITKPLIVPIILLFLIIRFKLTKHQLIPPLMVATFFSFLGDILLMLKVDESLFKMIGLCTYIVAQTAYGYLYYSSVQNFEQKKIKLVNRWPEALTVIFATLATLMAFPNLGVYAVPAIIYAIISTTTIILALNRRFYVSKISFIITILGVSSFFIGDTLMGGDLYLANTFNHFLILLTYILGHLLIICGMMLQIENEAKKKRSQKQNTKFLKSLNSYKY
ncbi:lysoplasmalogenase [Belliella marina]|uniref:Lysoplasmalogenase n=1 Tax=Belliella marina TaxID=1644146 RepID=A0ABW4VKR1_9BACT